MKTWILIMGFVFSSATFAEVGLNPDGTVHDECKRVFASSQIKPMQEGKTCVEAYGEGAIEDGNGNCVIPSSESDSADR